MKIESLQELRRALKDADVHIYERPANHSNGPWKRVVVVCHNDSTNEVHAIQVTLESQSDYELAFKLAEEWMLQHA